MGPSGFIRPASQRIVPGRTRQRLASQDTRLGHDGQGAVVRIGLLGCQQPHRGLTGRCPRSSLAPAPAPHPIPTRAKCAGRPQVLSEA